MDERINIVRQHFVKKGYRVHSGLQFGCELVLYADAPNIVHSDFCVHVLPEDARVDWRNMQTLVRSMPHLRKTLILANVRQTAGVTFEVDELAIATEHAPFRHRGQSKGVGEQLKKQKLDAETSDDA